MSDKKRFAGGWEYDFWQDSVAYTSGTVVAHGDYLYRAIINTTAGQKPREATDTFTLTDGTHIDPGTGSPYTTTRTFPVWVLWDLGVDYYYGLLRGVALGPSNSSEKTATFGVRTLVVRSNFTGSSGDSPDEHSYDLTASNSYAGYGMPSGMDTVWSDPEDGVLMYSPSMVAKGEYGPESYEYNLGEATGVQYQSSTNMTVTGSPYWDNGGQVQDTIGSLMSVYQTFSREYTGSVGTETTPGFQDNWTAAATADPGIVRSTSPDLATDT
jgi:hypothetical protein